MIKKKKKKSCSVSHRLTKVSTEWKLVYSLS